MFEVKKNPLKPTPFSTKFVSITQKKNNIFFLPFCVCARLKRRNTFGKRKSTLFSFFVRKFVLYQNNHETPATSIYIYLYIFDSRRAGMR